MMTTMMKPSLIAAAAVLALAGCASTTNYARPAAPVPATWSVAGTAGAAAPLPWQQFYTDAQLRELITLALQNNRDLRVALLNVEQARAQSRVQDASLLPTIGAGVTASRTPGSNGAINNSYQAGLQISAYEVDLFGRLRSLSGAALERYLASVEGSRAAQISLVAQIASSYLSLRANEELLSLAEQTLKTRDDFYRLTKLKSDNGVASGLDTSAAVSQVEVARASLAQQQRLRALDLNALQLLVGQALPQLAGGTAWNAQADVGMIADVPAGLPSEVLVNRPDILQAEAQLKAAEANIAAARAAFFPSLTLTTSLGTASSELSRLFSNTVWSFAPQLLMPIFDSGRNKANLASAQAGRDIAVAQYEKAIQVAFREVADALAGRATLAEQLRATQAQARADEDRLKLVDLRFRAGASNSLELLDAQRSQFAARQAVVQLQLARAQNSVLLYKALGGGWVAQ